MSCNCIVLIHLYSTSCSAHQSEVLPVRETQREDVMNIRINLFRPQKQSNKVLWHLVKSDVNISMKLYKIITIPWLKDRTKSASRKRLITAKGCFKILHFSLFVIIDHYHFM